ncbi:MAG: hypothetical protein OEW15_06635 [Nitrospirota bacterium]|nr:hypothetical protein [Nitrospirota bacterium]
MLPNIAIADEFTFDIQEELRNFMTSVTTVSSFNDGIWFFDVIKRSAGHSSDDYKIYFASVPEVYSEIVRYWVILRIRNGIAVHTQALNVSGIAHFLIFLEKECGAPDLSDVNRMTIEAYEESLYERADIKKASKEIYWTAMANFFKDMQTWPQMPINYPVAPGNPFIRSELDRQHNERLVPDIVLDQLDRIYRNSNLPLEDRLIYWILRSIPSRVQEITSIKLSCIRPYRDGYVLTIPQYKPSAQLREPQSKLIHILDKGHGKFLLDLVKEQQRVSTNLQIELSDESQGYLMVSPYKRMSARYKDGKMACRSSYNNLTGPFVLTGPVVRTRMKKVSEYFNVCDENGGYYDAITHCFRHNGITERLYEGFSYVEIRDMSGHKGNEMIIDTSYVHVKGKEVKALAAKKRARGELGTPILFRGRILNLSPEKEMKLLRNPRAYRIGKLGICSDITSCKGDLFECLDCDFLVPDAENKDYYMEQCAIWLERASLHLEKGNKSLAEHAQGMSNLFQSQVDKISLSMVMNASKEQGGDDA